MRLFVPSPLATRAEVEGTPAQAHRLAAVMRRAEGGTVVLFNGTDGEWAARITRLGRGKVAFEIGERLRPPVPEPGPVLAFAPLKRDGTDLVVQKATELGASALQPVVTQRTVAARVNLDRLGAIAVEAAEQCERLTLPEVRPPLPLPDFLAAWPPALGLAAALERETAPLLGPGPAGLLVGPEGGFTRPELDLLRRQPFVVPVSLGRLVLRAETAAIAGLARLLAG